MLFIIIQACVERAHAVSAGTAFLVILLLILLCLSGVDLITACVDVFSTPPDQPDPLNTEPLLFSGNEKTKCQRKKTISEGFRV